jgi:hypothetical protein
MPIRAQAAGSLVSPHLASGRMRAAEPARLIRARSLQIVPSCREPHLGVERCRVAEPMLKAANERYRVYTVDEFLDECLDDGGTSPLVPAEVPRGSRGARRRDWGARLLGAAMLFASVGTVAGLAGSDLWPNTASSRRARPSGASVDAPARPVGNRTDSRPDHAPDVPLSDARAASSPKPSVVARTRRARVRRVRADVHGSRVSRRVALPTIRVQAPPRGERPLMTAAASVTTSAARPRRSSAEFGFER